jgi:LAS superfamily LD-carboxypeptidase LdcB
MNSIGDALAATRSRRAIRAMGAAVALGAPLVAVPWTAPRAAAIGPVPACRIADVLTVPDDYESWRTTLVDWLLRVPADYVPPDLVPTSEAEIAGGGYIRAVALDDLRAMAQAATKAGTPISVISAYRTYQDQVASFNGWVAKDSYANAITYSQRPGHSEHQLGLAIDFKGAAEATSLSYPDWAQTPTGAWMANNAWKYGWVLSYPKGQGGALFSNATCFHYEPWQYRYLGRTLAGKVHASGLSIREYLWTHYTMVDARTGKLIATATPTTSPSPTPTPTPMPSPTATPTPTAFAAPSAGPSAGVQPSSSWFEIDALLALGGLLVLVVASMGLLAWRVVLRH